MAACLRALPAASASSRAAGRAAPGALCTRRAAGGLGGEEGLVQRGAPVVGARRARAAFACRGLGAPRTRTPTRHPTPGRRAPAAPVAAAAAAAPNNGAAAATSSEGYDLVLSSGFLAFALHAGFLQAVEDVGLPVRGVMGTSAGALIGRCGGGVESKCLLPCCLSLPTRALARPPCHCAACGARGTRPFKLPKNFVVCRR